MKIFNKYTYLFLGILLIAAIVVLNFIPDLETEEFDQEVIDDIIEGVTTTTIKENSEQTTEDSIASIDELFKNPLHPYTKALMESIPKMDKRSKRLKALKGMVPSILELGDGCKLCSRFEPEECACGGTKVEPELVEVEKDHFARINLDILKS